MSQPLPDTPRTLKQILDEAREAGANEVEYNGVRYVLSSQPPKPPPGPVPDVKPEDVLKPMSVLDDYSEDEVLYWATPYFDVLQERKAHAEKLSKENPGSKEVKNG